MPDRRRPDIPEASDAPDFATLAILYRQPEAAVVLATVRALGIAAFACDAWVSSVASHWTVLLGGIWILVPSGDFDRAAEILAEIGEMPSPPRNLAGPRWLDVALHAVIVICLFATGAAYFPMPPRARGSYARPTSPI